MNDMKYLVKVSQFVNKTFALWVIIFGILGFIFPEIFKLVGPYVPVLLGVVMFGMGLTLSTADFREVVRRPKEVLTGVVAQFTIMPLSAYALCVLLNLPADVAVGMMLLGCAPGGTASNVVTFIARGDVALSVTVTSCTTLLAPIVTPALMYVFANQWLAIDPASMFLSIVQMILLPIAAGVVIHKLAGDKNVEKCVAALPIVSVGAIVVIAAAVVAATRAQLLNVGLLIFAAVAVQNAVGMLLGWYAARFMGMSLSKRKTLAFEVGMQNSGLAVALATLHFAAAPATALPAAARRRPAENRRGLYENVPRRNDPSYPQKPHRRSAAAESVRVGGFPAESDAQQSRRLGVYDVKESGYYSAQTGACFVSSRAFRIPSSS